MADIVKELNLLLATLKEENERLRIENNLLRQASEEQRILNGQLRVEITKLEKANSTPIHRVSNNSMHKLDWRC